MAETRWVLHVDLDQFIAAVEVLRRPELAGRPVVVGGRGDPTERGVVSTASYEAREYGVGSGMPLRLAARKLPDAIFLPVDAPAYDAASAVVMDTLRSLEWGGRPVVVEVLGWDEAFVAADRSPAEGVGGGPSQAAPAAEPDLGDPRDFAQLIRDEVLAASRLHCSVGIGNNKLQAKIATDFGKPDPGIYVITDESWFEEMGARPTRALWGIGSKISKRLATLGIDTVHQLATSDARLLAAEFGPTMGPWFHRLGRGVDSSPVDATPWVPRAHGREETFQEDLTEWADVEAADPQDHPSGGGRHRPRGPAGVPGRAEDPVQAVHHPHPDPQDRHTHQRPRGPRRRGGGVARPDREAEAGPAARRPAGDGRAGGRVRRARP